MENFGFSQFLIFPVFNWILHVHISLEKKGGNLQLPNSCSNWKGPEPFSLGVVTLWPLSMQQGSPLMQWSNSHTLVSTSQPTLLDLINQEGQGSRGHVIGHITASPLSTSADCIGWNWSHKTSLSTRYFNQSCNKCRVKITLRLSDFILKVHSQSVTVGLRGLQRSLPTLKVSNFQTAWDNSA